MGRLPRFYDISLRKVDCSMGVEVVSIPAPDAIKAGDYAKALLANPKDWDIVAVRRVDKRV